MILDVAELRERGLVRRRVDELDVDVDTWRAGMRRVARRERMRVRTFVVDTAPAAGSGAGGERATRGAGAVVWAVRTDLPSVRDETTTGTRGTDPGTAPRLVPTPAEAAVADQRARSSGHPCAAPRPGTTGGGRHVPPVR